MIITFAPGSGALVSLSVTVPFNIWVGFCAETE
jgi:hypothetical protein